MTAPLTSFQVLSLEHAEQLLFSCLCSKVTVIGENGNGLFLALHPAGLLSQECTNHKAGSQLNWLNSKDHQNDVGITFVGN